MAGSSLDAPDSSQILVEVNSLAKRFGKTTVVQDVSFSVRRGQLVGLVGANGGGKTTTLRMIAGLLRADAGSGQVLGSDIGDSRYSRIGQIGYMPQRIALYPDLSVRENLAFRTRAHRISKPTAAIDETVARYRLGDVLEKRVANLSGGWARRVQFAATVIHAPALLLLDEPTAGLDVATRNDIWAWLGELAKRGCGIIMSTHDLAEAERCNLIIPYHEGRAFIATSPHAFIATQESASLEQAVLKLAQFRQ
jgi:ABC-2 type transport system ATP-binding protein